MYAEQIVAYVNVYNNFTSGNDKKRLKIVTKIPKPLKRRKRLGERKENVGSS